MTARSRSAHGAALSLAFAMSALSLLVACSSDSADLSASSEGTIDGGGSPEADPTGESRKDGGADAAGDAASPPPYDFAVTCGGAPCATRIAGRGGAHACVVMHDGTVRCWGANASGQLGTGQTEAGAVVGYAAAPRPVLGITGATGVATAGSGTSGTTCVISGAGDLACFGSDAWGQLARGSGASTAPNPYPAPVAGLKAKSVSLTNTFALAVGTDDRLWSWGTNDARQLARETSGPDAGSATSAGRADAVAIAARACAGTSKTAFVVTENGELLSWGGGTSEELGRASSLARDPIPAPIALSEVSTVAAGRSHACALGRGRVDCWGQNEHGQLGTGRRADELLPARVVLPFDVYPVALAAGGDDTCVIAADGAVYCWGANESGQLGASPDLNLVIPVRIDGLAEQAVGLAVMDDAICALLRGGKVACWGDNLLGQLGRGSRDLAFYPAPAPVIFE